MRDPEAQVGQVRRIFGRIAPVYDLLNRVLSLRQDVHWRRCVARAMRLSPGARVLDCATGTGDLALAVAAHPARPRVTGVDLAPAMLAVAQGKAGAAGLAGLAAADAMRLPFGDGVFQAVTIAFGIRNIPRRVAAMAEFGRVLAPGGRLYVLEFTTPAGPLVRAVYLRYLRHLLPRLGGLLSGDRQSYEYLAETIMEFPPPAAFRAELAAAGLAAPRSIPLTGGVAWLHVAERPALN